MVKLQNLNMILDWNGTESGILSYVHQMYCFSGMKALLLHHIVLIDGVRHHCSIIHITMLQCLHKCL